MATHDFGEVTDGGLVLAPKSPGDAFLLPFSNLLDLRAVWFVVSGLRGVGEWWSKRRWVASELVVVVVVQSRHELLLIRQSEVKWEGDR